MKLRPLEPAARRGVKATNGTAAGKQAQKAKRKQQVIERYEQERVKGENHTNAMIAVAADEGLDVSLATVKAYLKEAGISAKGKNK